MKNKKIKEILEDTNTYTIDLELQLLRNLVSVVERKLAAQRHKIEMENVLENTNCDQRITALRADIKEMIEGMEKKDFEVDEQVIGNEIKTDVMKLRRNIGKQSYNQALTDILEKL